VSCGKPHATPCEEVIRKVYEYLDGELVPRDLAKIAQHLDECGPCLREYGVEEEVKALVRRACGRDPAPQDLRHRVLVRMRQVSLEVGYQP
jgi:mycothiol system anti-sigma-R factor